MAGFVLGTGSGVLAAAMVYYTLTSSLSQSTTRMRGDLHQTTHLLNSSFDPSLPLAPVSSLGPSSLSPPFSQTLRQRWNMALSNMFEKVHDADYLSAGKTVYFSGKDLIKSVYHVDDTGLSGLKDVGKKGKEIMYDSNKIGEDIGNNVEKVGKGIVDYVKEVGKEVGIDKVKEVGKEVISGLATEARTYDGIGFEEKEKEKGITRKHEGFVEGTEGVDLRKGVEGVVGGKKSIPDKRIV
ncbi:hypothetical protein M231_03635 [Tremella mesenterica]|uniref:Altered inheritance of mitochondria protein 5, mitochondrial n=1 Tax=Tremella mesenterica TaxID=5217 RepID=A0A4Q1BN09_TREME|nr:uncharacterized protein TREMEDRAFT_59431 [Tremella mesenterica DSM 1558]EIW73265.1 hypothetical protein TREMEDRAFT_59431 [Tremella mesenterica DSM 1558]RXK39130.1 hypothetical protein M231_03635 [Tremella mesenterica]